MMTHVFNRFVLLIFTFILNHCIYADNHCSAPFELSTKGSRVVDQCGNNFKLKSVNWYGAHEKTEVVGGLNKQPLEKIVKLIKDGGFNSVRLTFSNQMLHDTHPVDPKTVAANPIFAAETPLQVFDHVINALTKMGIVVILNNHTTISEWCCGFDFNGIWHHPNYQSTEQWINDWRMLAERYRNNPLVAGVDLRNEVRTARYYDTYLPVFPNWGSGDENDWKLAATQAANAIHAINPRMLIVVEGINWFGVPMLGGSRPMLQPVRNNPIVLNHPNKLVYEEHVYAFTGPKHTGDDKSSIGQVRYSEMDEATLKSTLDEEFGYVVEEGHSYTAPVWLGEFGVGYRGTTPQDQVWFERITNYLLQKNMGWAYWALNSQKGDGSPEDFGLLNDDWSAYRVDWRNEAIHRLLQE